MFEFLRELFGLAPKRRRNRRVAANDVLVASIHQRANSSRQQSHTPPPLPPVVPRNRVKEVPSPVPPPSPRTASRRTARPGGKPMGPAIEAALEKAYARTGRLALWLGRVLLRLLRWGAIIGVPAAALLVPGWLMVREVRGVGVEIGAIAVPQRLIERGIQPDVLAARLADRIQDVRRRTLADPTDRPAAELNAPLISVDITATSGLWHRTALALRDLLNLNTTRLTGELTQTPDGKLDLRLRVPQFGQVADLKAYPEADLDRMLDDAAPEVWQVAQPRLYAWYSVQSIYQQDLLWGHLEALRNTGRLDTSSLNTVSFLLIKVLLNGSRVEDALEFAENLTARAPLYAPGWYVKAMALLASNRAQDALEASQRMIEIDGGSVWGRKATARLLMSAGRFNEAYREVRSALRVNPEDIEGMILESSLHSSLGRVDEGIAVARRAVEFMPNQPGVHEVFANALMAKKLYASALAQLDTEISNHPSRISTRMLRGNVLLTMGRPEDALNDADIVLKDTPNSGQAIMIRGWALLALGRPQPAMEMMDRLLAARVYTPGVLQSKAVALEALGQRAAAVVYMRRALQQSPGNAAFLIDLERMTNPAE